MESGIDYLNLEYLLLRIFDLFFGVKSTVGDIPDVVTSFIAGLYVLGMLLSLLLLVLIVYAKIKLLEVEHAGFHALEAHAHEHHEAETISTGKNDRWERIVELASSGNQGDWRRAILEADIMLGDALAQAGYVGSGVGEQLKMANPIQLTTLDLAWKAHKVRNEVAHGGESYMLNERDKSVAIDYYKRVFEELGVI
jgi:hypothetical protein